MLVSFTSTQDSFTQESRTGTGDMSESVPKEHPVESLSVANVNTKKNPSTEQHEAAAELCAICHANNDEQVYCLPECEYKYHTNCILDRLRTSDNINTSRKNILFLGPTSSGIYIYLQQKQDHIVEQTEEKLDVHSLSSGMYDVIVSHKYRHIVRTEIIKLFEGRIINLHASYLPFNRGADPNLWSHLDQTPSGISIHHLTKGLDTGNIIYRKKMSFENETTLKDSYEALENLMVNSFITVFQEYCTKGSFTHGRPQCELSKGIFTFHFAKEKEDFIASFEKGWETSISDAIQLYAQWLYAEGSAYFYGFGKYKIDHTLTCKSWVRAANLGHLTAQGRCHFFGYEPYAKDKIKAIECWTLASSNNDPEGSFLLGFVHLTGYGDVKKNTEKGFALYQSAADRGVAPAINNCARLNEENGRLEKAWVQFYESAAEFKIASAQFRVGVALFFGELGQTKEIEIGLQWIKKSASQGYLPAKTWQEDYNEEMSESVTWEEKIQKDMLAYKE